jgi:hypothetical protein
VRFVVPADLERPTGGNHYDRALARGLRELGVDVELAPVAGTWPDAVGPAHDLLAEQLAGPDPVLVDGLLACGSPAAVAAAVAGGSSVHLLVHMPLALDPGVPARTAADRDARERATVHVATGVFTTSAWAAAELQRRHGVGAPVVATPGTDRAGPGAPVHGSVPPLLRQLATVSPVKDQCTVVAALNTLTGSGCPAWTAELTGALDVDPAYVTAVQAAIDGHGLADRVRLTGPLTGPDLDRAWDATDLLLLPSRAETWGLVVTEALSRGIPAVVSAGTGSVEALGRAPDGGLPGAVVPPGDPQALAAAIRHLLGPGRDAARRAALARGAALPSWRSTAEIVRAALWPASRARGRASA